MTTRTTAVLPPDYPAPGRKTADHYELARKMREDPGVWVLVSEPATRKAAHEAKRRVSKGYGPYRRGGYVAQVRRSLTGRHEVWGRYVGGDPR